MTALSGTPATRSVALVWRNPTASDFAAVVIRRAVGPTAPVSRTSGSLVATTGRTVHSYTNTGLASGTQYSYALFARDKAGNYSRATTTTLTTTPATTPATTNTLSAGQSLGTGQALTSANGQYQAVMQTDGNFVLYGPSGALWSTQTGGTANDVAMQADGNLVVYAAAGVAQWSSSTAPGWELSLVLQDDGNLVMYGPNNIAVWDYAGGRIGNEDTLATGATLSTGSSLYSTDGRYQAIMQTDGNFVVYGPAGATWSTQTGGTGTGSWVTMQSDGNLVVYAPGSGAKWSSSTAPSSNDTLVMQTDGNLVIYGTSGALWSADGGRIGGSGGTTPSGQGAASWARGQVGSHAYEGLCLTFTYAAWEAAGVSRATLDSLAGYSPTNNTYPIDEWDYWASGHPPAGQWHAGADPAPPEGAMIFFSNTGGRLDSHAAISLGGGQQISPDTTGVSGPEAVTTNSARTMLGWWLPK